MATGPELSTFEKKIFVRLQRMHWTPLGRADSMLELARDGLVWSNGGKG
jgi:hypothetical protein